MVFKKREENGGQVDENINTAGRPEKKKRKITRREARDQAFMAFARKIGPHVSTAIKVLNDSMKDEDVKVETKIRSAAVVLKTYHDLIDAVYEEPPEPKVVTVTKEIVVEADEPEVQEIQPKVDNRPIFSLRVINNPDEFKLSSEDNKEE